MNTQNIHWLGHSAFRIDDGKTRIFIDPYDLKSDSIKADIIFITHGHYDHYSPGDIAKIRKDSTVIVATKDVAAKIAGKVIIVEPDGSYSVGAIRFTTVPAYNIGKKFHPQQNHWVGYILTLSTGETIYHAGDTDFIPEMKTVKADIALLPCGGTYTMTAVEAAEAANTFKPKILIPMHWGSIVGSKADAEEVRKLFKGETVIKEIEP